MTQLGSEVRATCILVVDDEWLIRWTLGEVLGAAGYRVIEAGDAREAFGLITGDVAIDAVLLDLKLPDWDGLGVLRHITVERPSCPVIVMSAHGTADDVREAMAAGALHFLTKPFEQQVMLDVLAEALAPAG